MGEFGNDLRAVARVGQSATLLKAHAPLTDARRSGDAGSVRSDAATAQAVGLVKNQGKGEKRRPASGGGRKGREADVSETTHHDSVHAGRPSRSEASERGRAEVTMGEDLDLDSDRSEWIGRA